MFVCTGQVQKYRAKMYVMQAAAGAKQLKVTRVVFLTACPIKNINPNVNAAKEYQYKQCIDC